MHLSAPPEVFSKTRRKPPYDLDLHSQKMHGDGCSSRTGITVLGMRIVGCAGSGMRRRKLTADGVY